MVEDQKMLKELLPTLTDLKEPKGLSVEKQKEMFYTMNLIRHFDTKVKELWMKGEIYGLAHSYVGAEAIAVGACAVLNKEDYISSTHRGHGHTIAKGGDIKAMMAELFGKYEGLNKGKGGSMHIADLDIGMLGATGIVGSGMPTALGSAISSNVLGKDNVTICFHGDGGTNQGVWHESVNMAAAWKLPAIFLIENNQYAIATELKSVCNNVDLHKRAVGYGIEGVCVDGFNVFEVYKAVKKAVKKAKEGGGPTIIECKFMRIIGHFVADDQWYRDVKQADKFWEVDPIVRMEQYLKESKKLDKSEIEAIKKKASDDVEEAVEYARNECTEPPLNSLYKDIYADGEVIL